MSPPTLKGERLFFALWPEPALQRKCYAVTESVGPAGHSGRRAAMGNLHLTLAFLGTIHADVRAGLERHADGIHVPEFELTLDHIGCFPRSGILWLGSATVPAPLLALVNALKAAQSACGLVPENREFKVHITLARDLRRCPPALAVTPIAWPVHQFVLVRSNLGAEGARYQLLRAWKLLG